MHECPDHRDDRDQRSNSERPSHHRLNRLVVRIRREGLNEQHAAEETGEVAEDGGERRERRKDFMEHWFSDYLEVYQKSRTYFEVYSVSTIKMKDSTSSGSAPFLVNSLNKV